MHTSKPMAIAPVMLRDDMLAARSTGRALGRFSPEHSGSAAAATSKCMVGIAMCSCAVRATTERSRQGRRKVTHTASPFTHTIESRIKKTTDERILPSYAASWFAAQ